MNLSIYKSVSDLFSPFGFYKAPSGDSTLTRLRGDLHQSIVITCQNYEPTYRFNLILALRHSLSEEIFARATNIPADLQAESYTCLTPLQLLCPQVAQSGFEISPDRPLQNAILLLQSIAQQSIIPFFNSHTLISDLDRLLNKDEQHLVGLAASNRMMHGIIVSYFANGPLWGDHGARYRSEIGSIDHSLVEEFDSIVRELLVTDRL